MGYEMKIGEKRFKKSKKFILFPIKNILLLYNIYNYFIIFL